MYTVVIADDEKFICDGIKDLINSYLPELEISQTFHNGTLLYNYLNDHQPDILLLDIEMPGKSGLDIARLIDEQNHKSYVIIITAHHNFEYAKEAINAGVDAFLTKPYSSNQLLEAIRKAIDHVERKHFSADDHQATCRSLLQSLLTSDSKERSYNKLILCNGTAQMEDLLCTSVTFKDVGLSTLPKDIQEPLVNSLIKYVENDTTNQSSFFLENKNDCISFLVFSKKEPDLYFIPAALKIFGSYLNNAPHYTHETYTSLSKYYAHISFVKEMDYFFNILSTDGANHAKKLLVNYIRKLPEYQQQDFADFLFKQYKIAITDVDTNTLIESLDQLVNYAKDSRSGNYIVDAVKKYVAEHYSSYNVSLEVIADNLSVSSDYLGRIFKKYMGCTFSEYLLNFRMEHASNLLKTTHLSTIEIAEKVGYGNPAYFRISFKSYYGMTPRQFRMLQTGKE